MNRTATIVPVIAALVKAEEILGKDRVWRAISHPQKEFLTKYFVKRGELSKLSPKELRSWVDTVADRLNEVLRNEGFSIQLDKFKEDEFGVVAILDVIVEWLVTGEKVTIRTGAGKEYPGVRLESRNGGTGTFIVTQSPNHPHPIGMVFTKSGDTVCMTIANRPLSDFQLLSKITDLEIGTVPPDYYKTLTFPMVSLDETVDIAWLLEMATRDEKCHPWLISQAEQQTKFKMNETGARVKSAVAIGVMRGISLHKTNHMVIDKPFFIWIKRSGMDLPIFAAYLNEDVWQDPGNLDL